MRDILATLPRQVDPNLLVGHVGVDDAGVYRLDDERAIVLTVDFFTPVVDDPFDYGRVAAANSLSDVYAMGGRPIAAMNIAAFPDRELPNEVFAEILKGGAATATEAGIVIVGGHTVDDREIKYGLSVVGLIHPDEIVQNSGARPGDALILTKPIGTGVLTTALMAEDLADADYDVLIQTMTLLNREGGAVLKEFNVRACTDITGNGLLGHAYEMAEASDVTIEFAAADVPLLPGSRLAVENHHLTGGGAKNRNYIRESIEWARPVEETLEHLLFDPQTSGGLLIAVAPERSVPLLDALKPTYADACVIGHIVDKVPARLRVI